MPDNPFSEKIPPDVQTEPSLVQLEAVSSCPVTCLGEEANPHLAITSFQVVIQGDEVPPVPPLLQAKHSQLPQSLLIGLTLWILHQFHCPSLDSLLHLYVFFVVRGPELNTRLDVQPHQYREQEDNHCSGPAGHTTLDRSQDATGLLAHLGTLLAHVQLVVDQHLQVFSAGPLSRHSFLSL
ncbi:hypothetical protein BTVI_74001 [Pitangus sulphuratus]|nr:hypothetical protein BTVI_74001 [Pitangus sulphuratus]